MSIILEAELIAGVLSFWESATNHAPSDTGWRVFVSLEATENVTRWERGYCGTRPTQTVVDFDVNFSRNARSVGS